MDRDSIIKLIRDELQKASQDAKYNVANVPYHTHNGLDSPKLNSSTGSFSPAGSDTDIQINSNGAFGATNDFRFNDTTDVLTIGAAGTDYFSITAGSPVTVSALNQADLNLTVQAVAPGSAEGSINISTPNTTGAGIPGNINITAGSDDTGVGGEIGIATNDATGNGFAGNIVVQTGAGAGTGSAGQIVLQVGNAGTSGNIDGNGIGLISGSGHGSGKGGNITLLPGVGTPKGYVLSGRPLLATTDSGGFLAVAIVAGVPTGTPSPDTSYRALTYDTVNNDLYFYNGSWKKVHLA